jgi:hypothetical protein
MKKEVKMILSIMESTSDWSYKLDEGTSIGRIVFDNRVFTVSPENYDKAQLVNKIMNTDISREAVNKLLITL